MIRTVLAPNPGPMTLTGTNTYLICRGGTTLVVDPGPDDPAHLAATLAAAGPDRVAAVVATHGHADHTDQIAALIARTGAAPLDPRSSPGRRELAAYGVEPLATPGHTPDSVCLLVADEAGPVLLTGDTVLGTGPSVVADLGDYLASLERISALVARRGVVRLLPGHGPAVEAPAAHVALLQRHRQERLAQVRAAVAAGAMTPEDVVARAYAELPDELRPAALASAAAQLAYLAGTGRTGRTPAPG